MTDPKPLSPTRIAWIDRWQAALRAAVAAERPTLDGARSALLPLCVGPRARWEDAREWLVREAARAGEGAQGDAYRAALAVLSEGEAR